MIDKPSGLSDDDLWAKCQQGGPITSQDLGLNSSQNSSDVTTYQTEGALFRKMTRNEVENHPKVGYNFLKKKHRTRKGKVERYDKTKLR